MVNHSEQRSGSLMATSTANYWGHQSGNRMVSPMVKHWVPHWVPHWGSQTATLMVTHWVQRSGCRTATLMVKQWEQHLASRTEPRSARGTGRKLEQCSGIQTVMSMVIRLVQRWGSWMVPPTAKHSE